MTIEEMLADLGKEFKNAVGALTRRMDDFETAQNRARDLGDARNLQRPIDGRGDRHDGAGDPQAERRARVAFDQFIRTGNVERDYRDALIVGDDTAGGYLAPGTFVSEVLKDLVLFSPVRRLARVTEVGSGEALLPRRTGTLTAQWVGETSQRPSSQPAYGQLRIPVQEQAVYVDVSNRMLEDAAIDIGTELARDLSEEFGRLEGLGFLTGDTPLEPEGILINADVPTVASGQPTAITADAIIDATFALPESYRQNATWGAAGTTIAAIRKLKTGDGQYLWTDSLAADRPATLHGLPIAEMPDVPSVAGGARALILADWQRAYRIVDKPTISVLRDPYSVATIGQTRFHARRRVGGAVSQPNAARIMVIGT